MGGNDSEQDAAHNDAMRSKILSAETFNSVDTPSPNTFIQKSHKTNRRMMPRDDDDDVIAETFDSEDTPSPDNFLQKSCSKQYKFGEVDDKQHEKADVETQAISQDSPPYDAKGRR